MKTKLKVGDKIPHYLDGSVIRYEGDKEGDELIQFWCKSGQYFVGAITSQAYRIEGSTYILSIEAVDALIEQHEVSEGKFEDSFEFKGENYSFLLDKGDGYYIGCSGRGNEVLFTKAEVDRFEFQNNVLGYTDGNGDFPFCRTPQDAVKLYKAIKSKLLGTMNTEKKIIGYKPNELGRRNKAAIIAICSHYDFADTIVNSEATHGVGGDCEKVFTAAGVHDIWFEPVYEKEVKYKKGDKIMILNYGNFIPDDAIQLNTVYTLKEDLTATSLLLEKDSYGSTTDGYTGPNVPSLEIRHATPEEIKASEEEVVDMGGFKLTIRDKKVFHKSEEITLYVKNLVEKFKDCEIESNRGTRAIQISEITFVKTGCENSKTHLSQWRNIYDKIS